jgi:uncharacterized membrane protein
MIGQPPPLRFRPGLSGATIRPRLAAIANGQRLNSAILISMTLGSAVLACATAARRPIWYDELMTYHLVSQPDFSTFWAALKGGFDLNPPIYHLSVRALAPLLGHGTLALRLPSMVGFALMIACLFAIARPRVGAAAACVASLLPFTTRAYQYAFEARPYGFMMGFSALALYCWLAAAGDRRRPIALLGLTLSLAAAISSHLYSVVVFLALGLGELARTVSRRRLDPAMCSAFVLGALPLAIFYPVIAAARGRADDSWSAPSLTKCFDFYSWLISAEAIFPLIVLGLVSICLARMARRPALQVDQVSVDSARSIPVHECVAIVAFVLIPILTHILALTVTNAFTERYALPAVIGISLMAGVLVDWRARGRTAALVPALVLLCWAPFVQVLVYRRVANERDAYSLLSRQLERGDRGRLPILVADARDYLQLHYRAPEPLASRLIFVRGVAGSKIESSAAGEIERLGHWVDLKIDDLTLVQQAHPRFLVFGPPDSGLVTSLEKSDSAAVVTAQGPEFYLVYTSSRDINTADLQGGTIPNGE